MERLEQLMADAQQAFAEFKKTQLDTGKVTAGEMFGTREYLKNNYLYRMAAAKLGIFGNSNDEAMYPAYAVDANGQQLEGSERCVLRFAPGQLPPVNAFWSLTMYELPSSLLVVNPLNRYLINSPMLPGLKHDLQHDSPGKELLGPGPTAPRNLMKVRNNDFRPWLVTAASRRVLRGCFRRSR